MFRQFYGMHTVSEVIVVRRWMMVVIVRAVHGSTVEQLCWIDHRPQCRTVHQRWCIRRAVSKAPGAVYHWVDALAIRRLGETAPCAGGVRQTSDDGSAVYRRAAEPHRSVSGSATLAARNLSVCSTSRVAERAEWQRSRLQWPHPASSRCGSARFLAVMPVQQHAVASSYCL